MINLNANTKIRQYIIGESWDKKTGYFEIKKMNHHKWEFEKYEIDIAYDDCCTPEMKLEAQAYAYNKIKEEIKRLNEGGEKINCPLCGAELKHEEKKETNLWKCHACPFVGFEYVTREDVENVDDALF